ncbi:pterin 4 alpha carbinolamine dehydratase [Colletotrichum orchidophilum]|uniref:4a-hydroxytetrahydrobiopterin dehydratase n=1 Tax=Colletotrichum orchidophilum TaxID=1209926 RepID=A0A1G4B1E9_9PEZI|nr:pterin 4 alpha carbinolamine dehydratase [Colletotrichum orchidophilum]OHE95207.1 pterin 4 alpha carbinolamine dehydratase [Colletotrichum orchidophilum]
MSPSTLLLRRLALSTPRPLTISCRLSKATFSPPTHSKHSIIQQQIASRHHRTMSTTTATAAAAATPAPAPRFSKGSDELSLSSTLETLLGQGRGWALVNDGVAVERSFKFKNFAKTWDFMTAVSLQCKLHNHHPEWSNVYNTIFIRWTTHNPKGLSDKDLKLALICDALAKDFGEVEGPPAPPASEVTTGGEAVSCGIRGLADKAAGTAGDCCTPK